jgi:hypothetical protein
MDTLLKATTRTVGCARELLTERGLYAEPQTTAMRRSLSKGKAKD